jgi:hypothetical protein
MLPIFSVAECQFSIPMRVSDVGSINWSYEEGVEVFSVLR